MRKIPPGPLTGKQADGEQIIATIKKNEREEIVVKAVIFNGYPTVHVRLYFRDKEGKLKPTREGVTLKPGEQLETMIKGLRTLNDAHKRGAPITAFVMPLEPAQPPEVSEAYEASQASAPPSITSQSPPSASNGASRVYDEGGPYAHLSHEQLRDIFVPRNPDGTKREATPAEQAAYDAELKARLERAQRRQFPDR